MGYLHTKTQKDHIYGNKTWSYLKTFPFSITYCSHLLGPSECWAEFWMEYLHIHKTYTSFCTYLLSVCLTLLSLIKKRYVEMQWYFMGCILLCKGTLVLMQGDQDILGSGHCTPCWEEYFLLQHDFKKIQVVLFPGPILNNKSNKYWSLFINKVFKGIKQRHLRI